LNARRGQTLIMPAEAGGIVEFKVGGKVSV
jgi:hypothetical protein